MSGNGTISHHFPRLMTNGRLIIHMTHGGVVAAHQLIQRRTRKGKQLVALELDRHTHTHTSISLSPSDSHTYTQEFAAVLYYMMYYF